MMYIKLFLTKSKKEVEYQISTVPSRSMCLLAGINVGGSSADIACFHVTGI